MKSVTLAIISFTLALAAYSTLLIAYTTSQLFRPTADQFQAYVLAIIVLALITGLAVNFFERSAHL